MTIDLEDVVIRDQIAAETYFQLVEFMRRNPAFCVPIGLSGSQITLESQTGARLAVVCVGPEEFRMEHSFPIGGGSAAPLRWH